MAQSLGRHGVYSSRVTGGHRRRNASLDGLRGVAALAVVWAHVVEHLKLLPVHPLGGMGVLVFFVLSGYLIARIVAGRVDTPDAYRRFLRRRALRLGPAILALAILGPVVLVTMGAYTIRTAGLYGLFALTQSTAFANAAGVPVHPILAPTWSLTVEWTFYLLFPACYVAYAGRGRAVISVARDMAVAAGAIYLSSLLIPSPLAYYHLPAANLSVMLVGAALGLAHHAGWTGPERLRLGIWPTGGAAMIGILTFLPGSNEAWDYRLAVLPSTAAASALVINGCIAGHPIQRLLASRWLRLVGIRAYSLYLWHMSVLWITWRVLGVASWTTAAVACAILIPVVEISFRFLELPVLSGGADALLPHTADPRLTVLDPT